jgi:hypothetical protein
MSESNSNISVSFNPTEEIINSDKLEMQMQIPISIPIPTPTQPLMTGADEVSLPLFEDKLNTDIKTLENVLEPKVLEINTDLKSLIPIVNIKPEPNSFLIKIEQMVNYITTTIGSEKINATNIIIISTNLMLIVEQYKDLSGYQKKMLILDAIKKYINENVSDPQERISLMIIVNMTLPQVLDTLVTAINGNIKFEKDKVISWFKKVFCCSGSSSSSSSSSSSM